MQRRLRLFWPGFSFKRASSLYRLLYQNSLCGLFVKIILSECLLQIILWRLLSEKFLQTKHFYSSLHPNFSFRLFRQRPATLTAARVFPIIFWSIFSIETKMENDVSEFHQIMISCADLGGVGLLVLVLRHLWKRNQTKGLWFFPPPSTLHSSYSTKSDFSSRFGIVQQQQAWSQSGGWVYKSK